MNTYWRSMPGKVLLSERGRAYSRTVSDYVLMQRAGKSLAGRLDVAIFAFPPDKRTRDLDNLLKPVLDSLTKAGVWKDDGQIDALSIRRGEFHKCGALRVEVKEIA